MIDLNYDLNTVVGEFDESVVTVFQQWLHDSDFDKIVFERSYIDHIRMFHGAVPRRKYFKTVKGTSHAITRFLNFLGRNGNPLLRHYSVQCTWSDINDRLTPRMMPFACPSPALSDTSGVEHYAADAGAWTASNRLGVW